MKTDLDTFGLAALMLSSCAALLIVPDLTPASFANPAESAAIGTSICLTIVVVLRARGKRGSKFERYLFAAFLAFMPLVYVQARLRFGGSLEWLLLELGGFAAFALLALLGLRRSPWFLVFGIAAHGLFWDSWHPGRAPFMPAWYAAACLVIDLGWALYVATQVPAFRDAARPSQGAASVVNAHQTVNTQSTVTKNLEDE